MIQTFTIQGRLDGLNEYTAACRANRFAGANCKKVNQGRVQKAIREAGLVPMGVPIALNICWFEAPKCKGARLRDPDNIAFAKKFILDALQAEKVIPNDGFNEVSHIGDRFMRSQEPRIEVTIESEGE